MPGYRLSPEQKHFIVIKHQEGVSWSEIKTLFKQKFGRVIYNSTINDLVDKVNETGSTEERRRSGRPIIYDERAQRAIVRQAIKSNDKSIRDLSKDIDINPKKASKDTLNRILILNKVCSIIKPLRLKDLTLNNVRSRKKFARKFLNWSEDDWKKVIFSDESDLLPTKCGKVYVRLRQNQNVLDVAPPEEASKKFLTVKVWGAISSKGIGPLVRYEGTLNAERYRDILEDNLLENYPELRSIDTVTEGHNCQSSRFLFMDDNARPHRAKIVVKWKDENGIKTIDWPSCSPDLNIIENIWAYLEDELYEARSELRTPDDTWRKALDIWNSMDLNFINKLYNDLPIRIHALKNCQGGIIKY